MLKNDVLKDARYHYGLEIPKRKKRGRKLAHTENGFPHYSSAMLDKGIARCMCLDTCCQSDTGCICKTCMCRIAGKGH